MGLLRKMVIATFSYFQHDLLMPTLPLHYLEALDYAQAWRWRLEGQGANPTFLKTADLHLLNI